LSIRGLRDVGAGEEEAGDGVEGAVAVGGRWVALEDGAAALGSE